MSEVNELLDMLDDIQQKIVAMGAYIQRLKNIEYRRRAELNKVVTEE